MILKKFFGWEDYVSPLDQFLHTFNEDHPTLSASQLQEKNKYKIISERRDNPNFQVIKKISWDSF